MLGLVAISTAVDAPAGAVVTNVRITAGTASSGTAKFNMSSGTIALVDLTTPKYASCTSSALNGGLATLGSHSNPAASVTGLAADATINGCVINVGANYPLTITGAATAGKPWRIQADNATTNPSGGSNPLPSNNPVVGQATSVTMYNITLQVTTSSCSFPITGSIGGGVYTNTSSGATVSLPAKTLSTSNLTIGNITLKNGATSCIFFNKGDKISFATTYTISATGGTPNPIWLNAG